MYILDQKGKGTGTVPSVYSDPLLHLDIYPRRTLRFDARSLAWCRLLQA